MKRIILQLLLPVIVFSTYTNVNGQQKDEADTRRIVEAKNFIFKAQSATPTRGRVIQLSGEYDLTISGDTVIAYLPYYGRAYSAPINPNDGGIKFTSVNPSYSASERKKGWEIRITPGSGSDVQDMYLDIFENGSASLRVISGNRQPISFNGYIVEGKPRSPKAFQP